MDVIENFAYRDLLLMFKGELTPEDVLGGNDAIDDATRAYGVGAWYKINGREDEANEIFRKLVVGPMWPAFGHIAAEAELFHETHEH